MSRASRTAAKRDRELQEQRAAERHNSPAEQERRNLLRFIDTERRNVLEQMAACDYLGLEQQWLRRRFCGFAWYGYRYVWLLAEYNLGYNGGHIAGKVYLTSRGKILIIAGSFSPDQHPRLTDNEMPLREILRSLKALKQQCSEAVVS